MSTQTITIQTTVNAPISKVWECFIQPEHITQWNHASDDWHCPAAKNDVRVEGKFVFTMAAKDESVEFDFSGTYTAVEPEKHIAYTMDDGRKASVDFTPSEGGITVSETFEMEHENPEAMQRGGWQAILDNFKKHVESV